MLTGCQTAECIGCARVPISHTDIHTYLLSYDYVRTYIADMDARTMAGSGSHGRRLVWLDPQLRSRLIKGLLKVGRMAVGSTPHDCYDNVAVRAVHGQAANTMPASLASLAVRRTRCGAVSFVLVGG